jgi:hypothetical protein
MRKGKGKKSGDWEGRAGNMSAWTDGRAKEKMKRQKRIKS